MGQKSKYLFIYSLVTLVFVYGYFSHRNQIFPHPLIEQAEKGYYALRNHLRGVRENAWAYPKTEHTQKLVTYDQERAQSGLSLVAGVVENDSLAVRIIDMEGKLVHEWPIDWFEIWSDATHVPAELTPQFTGKLGTEVHGTLLADNGDLIFNFEGLGLVRLDICGRVIWKLPYRTHHSIYEDERGDLWVAGLEVHDTPLPGLPNYHTKVHECTVLRVSQEGEILRRVSLIDVLLKNDLLGLLHMAARDNMNTEVVGNTLHLNDVETFPATLKEGVFRAGDIMVSLRNIHTVLVFRQTDLKVTQLWIGGMVRQHDPDFIDGNTISVFDNYNITNHKPDQRSRILIRSFVNDQVLTYFEGSNETPFYTKIMGKHQWLPNGNLLITESFKGRAIEVDPQGRVVWEYVNLVGGGHAGILTDVQRLSSNYCKAFFAERINVCQAQALH